MVNAQILQRSSWVSTMLHLTMFILGHYIPWVRENVFLFGGMLISGVSGLLYAREAAVGYARGALGGIIAGGGGALIGIAISVLLGDVPVFVLGPGTSIAMLTGVVGGLWGELGARLKARLS